METLVTPEKASDAKLITAYEQLFQSPELTLLSIDRATLREAARLRAAAPKLRTPDAIHAAAAASRAGAVQFLTNDIRLRTGTGPAVSILDDALSP